MADKVPEKKERKTLFEKIANKKRLDAERCKTRVVIGSAIDRWRQLREQKGLKNDALVATFLLDSYFQTNPGAGLNRPSVRSVATETCEYLNSGGMSSSNEDQPEVSNGKRMTGNPSENKENGVGQDGDHEKIDLSLSVGDGHYLVDLGSSSEFIVDEECLLQLFKSCRECNQQCVVRKQAKGLKVTINQVCCICDGNYNWTNLPDEEENSEGHMDIKERGLRFN